MSLQKFTQAFGFKKTFIHIDIGTFFECIFLHTVFVHDMLVNLLACIRPRVPSHKQAQSVKTHVIVNSYVLKETSSVLRFSLEYLFIFCTISPFCVREKEPKQTGKRREKERKKTPNARSGLSSGQTQVDR